MIRSTARILLLALLLGGIARGQVLSGSAHPTIGDALRNLDQLSRLRTPRRPLGDGGLEQTFVLPEHPGQNLVSWYAFDWRHYDVASPSGGKGGIRLYFYARERDVAERALPVIRNAYLRLVDQFHYTPTRQIPFILYASEREFQTTNVFEVTEGTLGVTSPRDLKMSLPYFGDRELFREVCTHELAHQFAIQKLFDLAGDEGAGSAMDLLPLWFQEGLAEYYARGGLDPESDLFLRDLVWNPDPETHYEVLSFEDDRYQGYIPTYKLGQARVAFIAEVYGRERVQGFLEAATLPNRGGFPALVQRALNEPLEQVDARWRAWLRQRYFPEYAHTRQDLPALREIRDAPLEVEAFEVSPDGQVVFFRGLDREAGRVKLFLMDPRFPKEAVEVAADNQPGVESLHPIEHSILAVSAGEIAFAAQDGPGDTFYLTPYRYEPSKRAPGKAGEPGELKPSAIHLGKRRRLPLRHPAGRAFVALSDLAFSPDGRELAFVGLTDAGQEDIYVVSTEGGTARQLTDDPYAERDLAFGPDGLYFASDGTDHGRFNLFRLDLATLARTRLTTGDWNDGHPRPQADGSVYFSSTASGKPDLYLFKGGEVHRLTDFATGLAAPALAAGGRGLYASTFYRGRFRLVEAPRLAWLSEPPEEVAAAASPPLAAPRAEFPQTLPSYSAYRWSNWRPEAGILFGGGGGGGVAGEAAALFADVLRDHLLYLDVSVYNSFDFTEGIAVFESREGRLPWDFGVYNWDWPTADASDSNLSFNQREVGAFATLRLPLDRFRRLEFELSAGAVERYCLTDASAATGNPCGGVPSDQAAAWQAANSGVNPQLGPAVRYGYDTLRYDPFTGPLAGNSLWVELGGNYYPGRSALSGYLRLDAEQYWPVIGRARLALRFAAGASFAPDATSRTWERTWWLSSADNLRGYSPADTAYLIGTHYYVANAEFQFPLDPIIHLGFFEYLQGVVAMDFGGVFDRVDTVPGASVKDPTRPPSDFGALDARTLTGVLGVNFIFGPLVFRLHFGHPFGIGGILTPALQDGTSWVTNFTLRYLFF
ncbi:MAG TPA: hypothetical protein VMG32_13560 [Anaeromyxobacteraceae bacterium]|nr:hypothetical protein [Anaeromyxobacteraceae bacterium]